MTKLTFTVKAVWDEDLKIFFSESDIIGLHIEAKTLEEFKRAMHENVHELIVANHIKPRDFVEKRISDLIPTIFWEQGTLASGIAAE